LELLLVLYYSHRGELPLGRIGERLMINAASVTGTVDRLVQGGFVERARIDTDRRTVLARITPTGREAVDDAVPAVLETRFGLSGLTAAETRQLARLLVKLRRAHGDDVGHPEMDSAPETAARAPARKAPRDSS
jgi:DNA-binding MarR family transcriptional regulator